MTPTRYIKRFGKSERAFHFFLMITFFIQSATGFSRLFITTAWGKMLSGFFGGYESALTIHFGVGILMVAGFVVHIIFLLTKIDWQNPINSIFGPDSLVPNFQDILHLYKRILWFFGAGDPPKLNRWTYWEKFDYWAVFWGMPLLGVTGIMLMYPIETSRIVPGWTLNIAVLLHRAEAILAISYIFIVHFFIGHIRPASFPMNEAIFSGNVSVDEIIEEKPAWAERLESDGKMNAITLPPPATWYRVLYHVVGFSALFFGFYLLVNGIIFSRYIQLH